MFWFKDLLWEILMGRYNFTATLNPEELNRFWDEIKVKSTIKFYTELAINWIGIFVVENKYYNKEIQDSNKKNMKKPF